MLKKWLQPEILTALLCVIILIFVFHQKPTVGMADDGSFYRSSGHLHIVADPSDKSDAPNPSYIKMKYKQLQDAQLKSPDFSFERDKFYNTTQVLFLNAANLISKAGGGSITTQPATVQARSFDLFDMRALTLVCSLFFVLAIFLFIKYNKTEFAWLNWLMAAIALFLLCDAGYILYFNSFYYQAAIIVTFVMALALGIAALRTGKLWLLSCFVVAAAMFVWATPQNTVIVVAVAAAFIALQFLYNAVPWKVLCAVGAAVAIACGVFAHAQMPNDVARQNLYNSVFYGILHDTKTPEADMAQLGLDEQTYKKYASKSYFELNDKDLTTLDGFFKTMTAKKVALFYLSHPDRLAGKMASSAAQVMDVRPSYLGNFEEGGATPPGALSDRFAAWSYLRARVSFYANPVVALLVLAVATIGIFVGGVTRAKTLRDSMYFLIYPALALFAVAELAGAVVTGGDNELAKRLLLFNMCVDVCFAACIVGAIHIGLIRRKLLLARYGAEGSVQSS